MRNLTKNLKCSSSVRYKSVGKFDIFLAAACWSNRFIIRSITFFLHNFMWASFMLTFRVRVCMLELDWKKQLLRGDNYVHLS